MVPTLGRAMLGCTAVPRPAYVGPQKALRGCSEDSSDKTAAARAIAPRRPAARRPLVSHQSVLSDEAFSSSIHLGVNSILVFNEKEPVCDDCARLSLTGTLDTKS
jgi:hypothetical protein